MSYQQHPLSAAFPAMTPDEFQDLKDSIENNGVLNPITIYDGMVIDGWHRYKAANDVGLPCPETELDESVDPKDFVLAQNKNRRHITAAQLAMATTAVYEWQPSHRPNNTALSAELIKTAAELAEISGTSKRTIEQAKAVLQNAAPEVQEAVKSGKIGLAKAEAIAKLPKEEQAAAIDRPLPKSGKAKPEKQESEGEKPVLTKYYGPDEEELLANELAERTEREIFHKMMEADDKLATAYEEVKRLNFLNAQLQTRINVLMVQKTEAVQILKSTQTKYEKLLKAQK
jgi:hypothetical protein